MGTWIPLQCWGPVFEGGYWIEGAPSLCAPGKAAGPGGDGAVLRSNTDPNAAGSGGWLSSAPFTSPRMHVFQLMAKAMWCSKEVRSESPRALKAQVSFQG